MNVNKVFAKEYENKTLSRRGKNKANTKPIKANIMPKQTQNKPKQSQLMPIFLDHQRIIRMKGIFYLTYIHRTAMYSNYWYFIWRYKIDCFKRFSCRLGRPAGSFHSRPGRKLRLCHNQARS